MIDTDISAFVDATGDWARASVMVRPRLRSCWAEVARQGCIVRILNTNAHVQNPTHVHNHSKTRSDGFTTYSR